VSLWGLSAGHRSGHACRPTSARRRNHRSRPDAWNRSCHGRQTGSGAHPGRATKEM